MPPLRFAPHTPALVLVTALLWACGSAPSAHLEATMAPMVLEPPAPPSALTTNHFKGDQSGVVDEAQIREILAAPVFLETGARIGIVPVVSKYAPDEALPVAPVTGALADALERTGLFDIACEVTTDWPTDRGISGLRELAARYRAEYLLLYRHRFVDRDYVNGWALGYFTILGAFVVPSTTQETAGVLEATLFDVKTGTLLFTVYDRVRDLQDVNVWHNERKLRDLQLALLTKAAERISDQVTAKVRRLAQARPADTTRVATAPGT